MIEFTSAGKVVARMRVDFGRWQDYTSVLPASVARSFIETVRAVPRQIVAVDCQYPNTNGAWLPFNQEEKGLNPMNFEKLAEGENVSTKSDDHERVIWVAAGGQKLPDDGILRYVAVESVYDFQALEPYTVAVVSAAAIDALKCVADNTTLFGIRMIYLAGVPDADYSLEFDAALYRCERAAYTSVISEIRLHAQVEEAIGNENLSQFERERKQYSREDGSVRPLTEFEMHTPMSDDSIGDDE